MLSVFRFGSLIICLINNYLIRIVDWQTFISFKILFTHKAASTTG